jgi:sugar phosphate isomerase/epimerase
VKEEEQYIMKVENNKAFRENSIKERLFLSTLSEKAAGVAAEYGLGLEISEFCTAYNMDKDFPMWDSKVKSEISGIDRRILHAPFNELFPSAIEPMVVEAARKRYAQSFSLARSYGINRMVVHAGHVPAIYYDIWFVKRSVEFWKEYLKDKPDSFRIMLENVLEEHPEPLAEIAEKVDDPRLGLCLDIGHANINSRRPLGEWINVMSPYLKHVHLHDNQGIKDQHLELGEGTIQLSRVIEKIESLCPGTTYTLETLDPEKSISWLAKNSFLKEEI